MHKQITVFMAVHFNKFSILSFSQFILCLAVLIMLSGSVVGYFDFINVLLHVGLCVGRYGDQILV